MSQILGSNSYLKITTGALNYNAAYTVLLHYRLDTAPSSDYVAVMSLNNDGEAELSDCDAYQINPFADPDVHRINTRSNSAGTALGGSASVTTTNWYNPVMVRSSATSLRGYLGSTTETAIATNDMSARSTATNVVLAAILSSGGATEIAGVTLHSCKIWTAALTSTQLADEIVKVEPVYQSNLYGWYFFDNSADKWSDRSGNGHHFTLVGTSTHTADKPSTVDETIGTGSQVFSVATTGNDTTGDGSLTNPYASITKALTVVASGDTILVADGTYSENTVSTGYFRPTQIFSSYVTIRSASGIASNVIIQGASNATYNTLIQNNAAYIRFENVTFGMRLSTNGSALRLANSNNIQFVGCKFVTQSDSGGTRYGVLLQPSGATVIDNILFDNCTWTQTGTFAARGVSVVWTSGNTISNISLTNCTATMQADCLYLQGGGYTITGGSYTSTDTHAILFGADSNTGGNLTTGSISGATITCTNGHGLIIGNNAGGVTATDCVCSGGDYGIVIKENTGATVTSCTATGNSSGGAAIYCKAATGASVTYCTENQSVGVGFKVGVGDTGNKCSNITHAHCTVNISGTANALLWGDSTADLGGGVEDYNAYEIAGTGNFGSVRTTSGITTLAALQAAWTGYDVSGNDTNSTFGGSQSSSKTFVFATDAEGLADAGNAASLVFAYVSADGNPAGSIGYTTTLKSVTQTEFARRASTGQTWETWGVPTGATVTNVVVAAWNEKTAGVTKLSSHSLKARIINSSGTTIHSAGDLLNATLSIASDTTWQSGTAGSSVAVDTSYQASTTDVRLELEYTVTTSGGGDNANVDQRFDNIRIDITYTPASGGQSKSVTDSGSGSDTTGISVGLSLTETGSGADSFGSSTAASTTDSGIGADALTPATVSAPVADSAVGVDVLSQILALLSTLDSGAGIDAIIQSAIAIIADSGSGTETISLLSELQKTIADGGTGSDVLQALAAFAVTDGGGGSDALAQVLATLILADSTGGVDAIAQVSALLATVDNGSGTDVMMPASVSAPIADIATGADVLAQVAATLAVLDSATGNDAPSVAVNLSVSDLGSASEAINILSELLKTVTDSGAGTDSIGSISVTVTTTDVGSGGDVVTLTVTVAISDVGSAAEAISLLTESLKSIADSGAGTDSVSPAVTLAIADGTTGSDTVGASVTLAVIDSGSGADTATLVSALLAVLDSGLGGDALSTSVSVAVSESGISVDVAGVTVALAVTDSSSGVDIVNLITESLKSVLDSASGADVLDVVVTLSTVDTGSGSDSVGTLSVGANVDDVGSATEGLLSSTSLAVTDSGSSIDALLVAVLATISDFASGADNAGSVTVNVPVTDMAAGVDVLSQISAALAVLESGSGVDVAINFDSAVKIVSIVFSVRARSVVFGWSARTVSFLFTNRSVEFSLVGGLGS